MCNLSYAIEEKGENKLALRIQKLIAANRTEDIAKVSTDVEYRRQLYKEFAIS